MATNANTDYRDDLPSADICSILLSSPRCMLTVAETADTDPEYMSHGKIRSERIIAISRVNMFLWRPPQSGRSSRRVTLNGRGPASAPRQRTAGGALGTKIRLLAKRNYPFCSCIRGHSLARSFFAQKALYWYYALFISICHKLFFKKIFPFYC